MSSFIETNVHCYLSMEYLRNWRHILSGKYYTLLFGLMVKFGLLVFYLFGLSVNFSAFQFSIYSALWIHPNVPVCHYLVQKRTRKLNLKKKLGNNIQPLLKNGFYFNNTICILLSFVTGGRLGQTGPLECLSSFPVSCWIRSDLCVPISGTQLQFYVLN